jgi:ubiquitin-like protein Pup
MPDQTRKPRPKQQDQEATASEQQTGEARTKEVDDLLDEIDEVLEDNAEEFVRSYVQKGGQ